MTLKICNFLSLLNKSKNFYETFTQIDGIKNCRIPNIIALRKGAIQSYNTKSD